MTVCTNMYRNVLVDACTNIHRSILVDCCTYIYSKGYSGRWLYICTIIHQMFGGGGEARCLTCNGWQGVVGWALVWKLVEGWWWGGGATKPGGGGATPFLSPAGTARRTPG